MNLSCLKFLGWYSLYFQRFGERMKGMEVENENMKK